MIQLFWLDQRWVLMFSTGLLLLILAVGGWQLLRRRSRHLPAELWLAGMALFGLFYLGLGLYPVLEPWGLQGVGPVAGQLACLCQAAAIRAIAGRPAFARRWLAVLVAYMAVYLALQMTGKVQARAALTGLLLVGCHLWTAWSAVQLGRLRRGPSTGWISLCSTGTALTLSAWLVVRVGFSQPLASSPGPWPLLVVVGALMLFQIGASLAFAELVLDELGRAERQAAERVQRELGRREGQARLQDLIDLVRRREQQMALWLDQLASVAQPLADARRMVRRAVAAAPSGSGTAGSAMVSVWRPLDERLQHASQALERELLPSLLREQRLPPPTRPWDVAALLEATLDDLPAAWRAALRIDRPDRLPRLRAQPWLLRHALRQLLDNAHRHGRGGEVVVALRPAFGRSGLRISVSDRGPGYSAELLARWRTADAAAWMGDVPGEAPGVAVVARVAWLHGGRLQLANGAHGGACASLLLPAHGESLPDEARA